MPKDTPAYSNSAIEGGEGTPQDGTVRHQVVDSEGNEVVPEHVGTTSVHELAEPSEQDPAPQPAPQDDDDDEHEDERPRARRPRR